MGGVTTPEDNPTSPLRPPPPPDPFAGQNKSITDAIGRFTTQLNETNPQFFEIGQGLIDQGLGTATNPLIEAQRERGLSAQRAQLVRGGVTGGAAMNQQSRLNQGFNEAALGARSQSLQGGLQLQQSALLQNLLAEPTLGTAQLSANKAGGGGGGGKK